MGFFVFNIFIVMEGFTSKQERGFELIKKALMKKFPYVKDMSVVEENEYFLHIAITVEFFQFITFYDVSPKKYYIKYGVGGIKEYFKKDRESSYVFAMIDFDENEEIFESFGNIFNKKIQDFLQNLYESLPDDYVTFKWDWHERATKNFRIEKYVVIVDESKETPALKNMLDPEFENARKTLFLPN